MKVLHPRKEGEYRLIEVVSGQFLVKHKFNDGLRRRLKRVRLLGITYEPDEVWGGKWWVPITFANALRLLKFASENDYLVRNEALEEFAKVKLKVAEMAQTPEGLEKINRILSTESAEPASVGKTPRLDTDQTSDSPSLSVKPPSASSATETCKP